MKSLVMFTLKTLSTKNALQPSNVDFNNAILGWISQPIFRVQFRK